MRTQCTNFKQIFFIDLRVCPSGSSPSQQRATVLFSARKRKRFVILSVFHFGLFVEEIVDRLCDESMSRTG